MNSGDFQLFRRIWFIGFAGHRKVDDPAALKAVIRNELDGFCASLNGEVVGLASAAAGADLLFLDACEEAGILPEVTVQLEVMAAGSSATLSAS